MLLCHLCGFCFFFSSRRRHTRFDCDWSQTCALPISLWPWGIRLLLGRGWFRFGLRLALRFGFRLGRALALRLRLRLRSEERRVGKECRSRWAHDHLKKNRYTINPQHRLTIPAILATT